MKRERNYVSSVSGVEVRAMSYSNAYDRADLEAWLARERSTACFTSLTGTKTLWFNNKDASCSLSIGQWLVRMPDGGFKVLYPSWFNLEFVEVAETSTFSFDAETLSIISDLKVKYAGTDLRDVLKDAITTLEAAVDKAKAEGSRTVTIPPPESHATKRLRAAERLIDIYSKYVRPGEKNSVYLSLDRDPKQRDLNARELAEAVGEYNKLA